MNKAVAIGLIAVLGAGVLLAVSGCNGRPAVEEGQAGAVEDAIADQRFCPVMPDMTVDRNIYVDHEGRRVYFCCAGCIDAFQADPEKYLAKLAEIHADPAGAVPEHGAHDHDHDHQH